MRVTTDSTSGRPKTIIVTGLSSAGTGIASSVLATLGVPVLPYSNGDIIRRYQQVGRQRHDGVRPSCVLDIPNVDEIFKPAELGIFDDPGLIVVTSDQNTSQALANDEPEQCVVDRIKALAAFERDCLLPKLTFRHDMAMIMPEMTVQRILEFCGAVAPPAQHELLAKTCRRSALQRMAAF